MNPTPKIFILGYARHGKDTFAELLCEAAPGTSFVSSSLFVAEHAVYPTLRERYGYATLQECYEDRMEHRAEWHQLISTFNTPDLARLSRALFREHDLYVGLRCIKELVASRHLADTSIWVDRSRQLPAEPSSSNTITPDDCDLIVDNNRGVEELRVKAGRIARALGLPGT